MHPYDMIIVLKILIAASLSFSIHSTDIPPYQHVFVSWEPAVTWRHDSDVYFSSLAGGQFESKSSGDYPNFFEML